ncbi:hypothetical protein [Cryptosporangium phraense]|uniref:hypothetical protein n=1 Tax=Cryptosporangium phraense TaxID=2593070 RepID=UPI0014795382|nr:hypothetical protein [Cryptosporangium phraense]
MTTRPSTRRRPPLLAALLLATAYFALLAGILGVHTTWIIAALVCASAATVVESRSRRR